MSRALLTLLTSIMLLAGSSQAASATQAPAATPTVAMPKVLRACGDDSGWYPYTYLAPAEAGKPARVTGYSVEYLKLILQQAGYQLQVHLLPWRRCLVESQGGKYDIALDVVRSAERLQHYLFPRSHYTVTTVYLYDGLRSKPELHKPDDVLRYQVCQQAGYSYQLLLPEAMRNKINGEAKSIETAFRMLESGRCDVLLQSREIIDSYRASGRLPALAGDRFKIEPLALPEPVILELYAGVSNTLPYREALVELINRGIAKLEHSADVRELQARFLLEPEHR